MGPYFTMNFSSKVSLVHMAENSEQTGNPWTKIKGTNQTGVIKTMFNLQDAYTALYKTHK